MEARASSPRHVSGGLSDGLRTWTMVRRKQSRGLGGSRVYKGAIRGRQNGNPGSAVFHGLFSYNTSRRGVHHGGRHVRTNWSQRPGFTNYESVRFFGGRAFASCERRWNTTSPLDQLRASATRLSLIERYLRSRSRLNRDPRDSSWLGVSRPAAIGSCPPPWPFGSTGSSLSNPHVRF